VKLKYVEDGKCSGQPVEITEAVEQSVLALVSADHAGHKKSLEILAFEAGILSYIFFTSMALLLQNHHGNQV
jgi:hypothetical protein